MGSGGIAPRIIDIGTGESENSSAAMPPGKEPPVTIGYEAGWANGFKRKKPLPLPGKKAGCPAQNSVTILTGLAWVN
jgi:hypothetical protein